MENKNVWLIHLKASIGARSSLNMDGSKFAIAVGVASANSVVDAIIRVREYLVQDHMDILEISKCEIYQSDNFSDSSDDSVEVKNAAELAMKKNEVVLACGVSSEALTDSVGSDNDE